MTLNIVDRCIIQDEKLISLECTINFKIIQTLIYDLIENQMRLLALSLSKYIVRLLSYSL